MPQSHIPTDNIHTRSPMSDSSSLADNDIIILPRVLEFYLPAGYIRRMLSNESDTASEIMSALERLLEIERLCAQLQAAMTTR